MPLTASLKTPTAEQNHSYGECLRFDHLRLVERGAGRSGYLSAEHGAQHAAHYRVVADALDAGVGFDRLAFEAA